MLVDANLSPISQRDQILAMMQASDFEFYLTGSRIYFTATEDSDWDFIAHPSCRSQLVKWGFKLLSRPYAAVYQDTNIKGVYRHDCGIDVQLTDELAERLFARDYILMSSAERDVLIKNKGDSAEAVNNRIRLWNRAFNVYRAAVYRHVKHSQLK